MDADGFRLLFEYNAWANDRVLEKAGEAGGADYHAVSEGLSFGVRSKRLAAACGVDARLPRRSAPRNDRTTMKEAR